MKKPTLNMVKIRISSESPREIEDVVHLFESLFPDMRFTAARLGGNPKYADDPKYFSYGEPRVRNKEPIPINFKQIGKKLLARSPAAVTKSAKPAAKKPVKSAPKKTTPKPAAKPDVPNWQRVLELDGVAKLTWTKCRARYRELVSNEITQARRDELVAAMEEAARYFKLSF